MPDATAAAATAASAATGAATGAAVEGAAAAEAAAAAPGQAFPHLTDSYWVTELNHLPEVRREFDLPAKVRIHDVTLREAEQAPHIVLRPDEKLRIYDALDDMGVHSVEVFPIISEDDRELAKELCRRRKNAKIFFLCRWIRSEVDFALEAGADGVVTEGPGHPWLAQTVIGKDEDQLVAMAVDVTKYAKDSGLYTVAMPWDTLRAPLSFLERMYKSLVYEAGADSVTIADTFGFGLPWTIAHLVRTLRGWVPGVPVEMHAHNDFGLATSVMLSAVAAGAEVVHTSVDALGERAGNAATDEVVLGIETLLGVDTGVRMDRLYPVSHLVAELAKVPVAPNKPVVGDNEFTIESGQVVYLVERLIKAGRPFQAYTPELIGRKGFDVILGKMSGGEVVANRLAALGIEADKEQVAEILARVKREASVRKWSIPDEVLENLAREVLGEGGGPA